MEKSKSTRCLVETIGTEEKEMVEKDFVPIELASTPPHNKINQKGGELIAITVVEEAEKLGSSVNNYETLHDPLSLVTSPIHRDMPPYDEILATKPEPLPTPSLRHSHMERESVPGAFPVPPSNYDRANNPDEQIRRIPSTNDQSGQSYPLHLSSVHASGIGDAESGLAIANLIDDPSNHPELLLPQAEDVDVKTHTTKTETQESDDRKTHILFGICFLVGILIIALVSLVMGSPEDEPSNKNIVMGPMTSQENLSSNSVDARHVLSLFPEETQLAIEEDPSSPQAQAYNWLMDDNVENLSLLGDDRIKQRLILATLFVATGGVDWTDNSGWLSYEIHECDWYNQPSFGLKHQLVQLYPSYLAGFHDVPPSTCDDNGIYQHLWLDQNNLSGSLPQELYQLTTLHSLSAVFNTLDGGISSHIGLLSNLEGIDLAFSFQSAGAIPSEIGLASDMRVLGLVSNGHDQSIPSELWRLTKLEGFLGLAQNPSLRGTLGSEIGQLTNLKVLNLEGCSITGTLPSELGQMDSLEWLFLLQNNIHGTIPTEIGKLDKNLLVLSLSANAMTGTLPSQLGELTSSNTMNLHSNHLNGKVPTEFGRLTSLTWGLTLHDNGFDGTIPKELSNIVSLQNLQLQSNQFTGHIPSQLGILSSLTWLAMANNSLSGVVPQELSALQQSLHTLTLDDNNFLSGILPDSLCEINGTCTSNIFFQCEGNYGLSFDCTAILCGCGCPCGGNTTNNTL